MAAVASYVDDDMASYMDDDVASYVASYVGGDMASYMDDNVASYVDHDVASYMDYDVASYVDDGVASYVDNDVAPYVDDDVAKILSPADTNSGPPQPISELYSSIKLAKLAHFSEGTFFQYIYQNSMNRPYIIKSDTISGKKPSKHNQILRQITHALRCLPFLKHYTFLFVILPLFSLIPCEFV
jgi:hypothetical protein